MKKATTLDLSQIKAFLPNHRICLLKVLLLLVNGILLSNSCNLNKVKKKGSLIVGKQVNPQSTYTRFIRFFKMKGIAGFTVGVLQLVLSMALPYLGNTQLHCLALDRTNWKLGKLNINILYVGLVLGNGYFIPLFFTLLNKRGNSSQAERITLFDTFTSVFNLLTNLSFVVVGDREFIGMDWFTYLLANSYEFVMRLRKKDYLDLLAEQQGISVDKLKKKIAKQVRQKGCCVLPLKIGDKTVYYHVALNQKKQNNKKSINKRKAAKKNKSSNTKTKPPKKGSKSKKKDKYIRFLSTKEDHQWTCEQYGRRWKIEVFFEDCKSKGFDLEAISFKQFAKIRLMVAICSLCYILCLIQGIIAYQIKEPMFKIDKRSNKKYKRTSVFTKGYELIEQIVLRWTMLVQLIEQRIASNYVINQKAIHKYMYGFTPCQK